MATTVRAKFEMEIEIQAGDAATVCKEIAEMLDGYEPSGGDAEYTITESKCRQAAIVGE